MEITRVIANNLRRSGYFDPVDESRFAERTPAFDARPQFDAWRENGIQAVVTGRATRDTGGRLRVEFRPLGCRDRSSDFRPARFFAEPATWRPHRPISCLISVYSEITGIPGFFDTRIVFVDETGPRDERRKRLAIMDQDGANVRYLTPGDNSVVTPRFSPRNQEIAFMAQSRGEQPRVQVLNIETGARQAVGNFPDMTSSPRFSPDGRSILMALQQGGNANLYQIDLHSRTTTRLTSTGAIDTSPSFSPDGSRIVFESDRGGAPAALCDERGRLGRGADFLRRRLLFAAGLVPARRSDRLHPDVGRPVLDRGDASRRLGRAYPDGGVPQRESRLGAEWTISRLLPRAPPARAADSSSWSM